MVRLARVGGTVGAAAWDFANGLPAHRMLRHRRSARSAGGAPERFFRLLRSGWNSVTSSTTGQRGQLTIISRLSESASVRLTERVNAAYLARAADGPRAFTATALGRARGALLRPMLRLLILLASAAALVSVCHRRSRKGSPRLCRAASMSCSSPGHVMMRAGSWAARKCASSPRMPQALWRQRLLGGPARAEGLRGAEILMLDSPGARWRWITSSTSSCPMGAAAIWRSRPWMRLPSGPTVTVPGRRRL